MFFIPGYIVKECSSGDGQLLFQRWNQSIRERDAEAEHLAKCALVDFFRRRCGERDMQAAAFLERLHKAESSCDVSGVVLSRQSKERNSYGYYIRRCEDRSGRVR